MREDKEWHDCMNLDELEQLKQVSLNLQKLAVNVLIGNYAIHRVPLI